MSLAAQRPAAAARGTCSVASGVASANRRAWASATGRSTGMAASGAGKPSRRKGSARRLAARDEAEFAGAERQAELAEDAIVHRLDHIGGAAADLGERHPELRAGSEHRTRLELDEVRGEAADACIPPAHALADAGRSVEAD